MTSKSLTAEDQAELQAINAALVPTDPWLYLTEYVITKDEHDMVNPYKKFPRKLMYRVILRATEEYNNLFIEKSRQIMLTWIWSMRSWRPTGMLPLAVIVGLAETSSSAST